MATSAPLVQIDHQALNQALSRLAAATENPSAVLRGIGEYLRNASADRFSTQSAPDGTSWTPLSSWYRASKTKNQDKVLTLNGYLRKLVWQSTSDEVLVGSNMEYAAIHQFGGTIKPKPGKRALSFGGRQVASVTIPARPFLGVSEDDVQEIESLVSDYLSNALDG